MNDACLYKGIGVKYALYMKEELFFSETKDSFYIKAVGHITAKLCSDLKRKVISSAERSVSIRDILVDLSDCEYMDSTFMGLLIGFHKRLFREYNIKLTLLNPSEQCLSLLKGLGIDRLLTIHSGTNITPTALEPLSGSVSVSTKLLLQAHENLMDLSEQNRKKFSLLHSILKEKLEEEGK